MTSFGGVLARYNRSFGGFHISAEFKNCISCAQPGWNGHINFNTPELRQRLIDHYIVPCTDHLKALAPTLPIGIPPSFFDKNSFLGKVNGTWMGAEQWGEWMVAFLTAVPNLDRFTYQDCVGSSLYSYPYADTVRYFKALRAAVDEANKQRASKFLFWSDLETFAFLQDYWVPASVTTRRPADMARITGQLAAEAPLVDGFSFYEWLFYMSPSGGRYCVLMPISPGVCPTIIAWHQTPCHRGKVVHGHGNANKMRTHPDEMMGFAWL